MGYSKKETKAKYSNSPSNRIKSIYVAMYHRCYNKNHKSYGRYSGKGVTICDEWLENPQKIWRQ